MSPLHHCKPFHWSWLSFFCHTALHRHFLPVPHPLWTLWLTSASSYLSSASVDPRYLNVFTLFTSSSSSRITRSCCSLLLQYSVFLIFSPCSSIISSVVYWFSGQTTTNLAQFRVRTTFYVRTAKIWAQSSTRTKQDLGTILWAINENMGTNLQALYCSGSRCTNNRIGPTYDRWLIIHFQQPMFYGKILHGTDPTV